MSNGIIWTAIISLPRIRDISISMVVFSKRTLSSHFSRPQRPFVIIIVWMLWGTFLVLCEYLSCLFGSRGDVCRVSTHSNEPSHSLIMTDWVRGGKGHNYTNFKLSYFSNSLIFPRWCTLFDISHQFLPHPHPCDGRED